MKWVLFKASIALRIHWELAFWPKSLSMIRTQVILWPSCLACSPLATLAPLLVLEHAKMTTLRLAFSIVPEWFLFLYIYMSSPIVLFRSSCNATFFLTLQPTFYFHCYFFLYSPVLFFKAPIIDWISKQMNFLMHCLLHKIWALCWQKYCFVYCCTWCLEMCLIETGNLIHFYWINK